MKETNPHFNLLLFFAGLGGAIYVQQFGTFAISEPLLVSVALAFVFFSRDLPRCFGGLLFVTLLWIVGVLVSDLYNEIDVSSTVKLTGSVTLFFINILSFYVLLRKRPGGAVYFVAGNMISYLLQFYYFPPPLAKEEFINDFYEAEHVLFTWVALTHYVAMMSFAGILWFFGWTRLSALVLLVAAGGALYLGSRAYFLIGLISAIALYFMGRIDVNSYLNKARSFSIVKLAKITALILLGTYAASLIYKEAALSGVLGDYAHEKYVEQSKVEGFGLASGRLDFFESVYAIARSPLLGYGSYAVDDVGIQTDFFKLMGITSKEPKELVPCHSHILGAWVWSGLLSLPFWLLLTYRIGRSLFEVYDFRLIGICIPYAAFVIWHMFFSPIGYRVDLSFFVGMLFALSQGRLKNSACGDPVKER